MHWHVGRRGQTILEYLLVASLVLAALVAIRTDAKGATEQVMRNAVNSLKRSADQVITLPISKDSETGS